MIIKIKQLRIKIDGLIQLTKKLDTSKEINESTKSLQLGKCWLGKVLQELGDETPYKNDGKRKSVDDIEKAADKAVENVAKNLDSFCKKPWSEKSHIEKVDWLREQIKNIMKELHNTGFYGISFTDEQMGDNYCNYFYQHMLEARFWLGFELGRIRDEQNK